MILLFLFAYQNSSGPLAWIYSAEVAVDSALGLLIFTLWMTVFILSLITNLIMDSALKPHGVFFLFSGISLSAAIYCYVFIKETKGLTSE
jgi:hypothetical protein